MRETFPTTPRASSAVRFGAIAIGILATGLATRTAVTSAGWIGRTFPGFVLLDNRVIASVGLANWSGTRVGGLYQNELETVDGKVVRSAVDAYAMVASLPPGQPVAYGLRSKGVQRDVIVHTQRFTVNDWFLLFAPFLLDGAVFVASGLVVWVLRPRAPLARTFLAFGGACGLFMLTAMDLYGPATFFRLHVLGEALLPAAALQMALLFPQPHRWAAWRLAGYAPAMVIIVLYETFLYHPAMYSVILYANMTYVGLVGLFFAARLVSAYRRGQSPLVRQRVRIITLGTLFGFTLPGVIVVVSAFSGGDVAMNTGALTPFLFALTLAYAIVKHDLFEIDAMVKRGAYYLVLTGAVGAAYAGAVVALNLVFRAGDLTDSAAFPVLFALAVLLLFNPLRTRLQALVDRIFFRTAYDGARLLATIGRHLAATLKRDHIGALVRDCVSEAIPNTRARLFACGNPGDEPTEIGGTAGVPGVLSDRLAERRTITAFDPTELYPSASTHDAVKTAMAGLDAEIAVPLQLRGKLVGVLTAGAKRSGLFYTAGDAEFLQALAHQTAIALENARSYEALVELNARLEERVRERTAQLEGANRELVEAYGELKNAESQLVHSEKMASLGRLVAGVAHEINNPVSFISTNIAPLRRRLGQAAALAPLDAKRALAEAEDITGIMARGAERTAAIVRDLQTFSRLDESSRKEVDLHEGLDVTLRLLEPRWRGRIVIHRDYSALPALECDPGQLNQAFMNVLANACDALSGEGNIWITTRVEDETLTVTIRDDGAGIPADVIDRIFDPFFTTKDIGSGTGLGLAISHTVIAAHGGRIDVESTAGRGTTFRITLPTGTPRLAKTSSTG